MLWRMVRGGTGFTRGLAAAHDLEFSIDGERVFLNTVGGPEDFANLMANPAYAEAVDKRLTARVPIKAGAHVVGVTFVRKTGALNVSVYKPLQAPVEGGFTVDAFIVDEQAGRSRLSVIRASKKVRA